MSTNHLSLIGVIAGIRSGKPLILGTRITVYDVLSYLESGMSHAEIIENFPPLTEEAILSCLSFAEDHDLRFDSSSSTRE
jgi:uncharacterized protein (DUF433 family)